jgi:methyl-accepting chemotaxis protein
MHPRLDELRKRLLTPDVPSGPAQYKAPVRGVSVFTPARERAADAPSIDSNGGATAKLNSSRTVALVEPPEAARPTVSEPEGHHSVAEKPVSPGGLAEAVAELFEPARQCQERLQEITLASEAISHLTRLAVELREPLKSFHDHIRKLSSSFESMRTFRDELGVLAESFAPVRALHQQVIQMSQTVRTHLAEVANALEPANVLKIEIADLGAAIDSVSELQSRFFELSEAFGDVSGPDSSSDGITVPAHSSPDEGK